MSEISNNEHINHYDLRLGGGDGLYPYQTVVL